MGLMWIETIATNKAEEGTPSAEIITNPEGSLSFFFSFFNFEW